MRTIGLLRLRVCFLLLGLIYPWSVWSVDRVTIDITTSAGKQTYEIVRLYPDRAVLMGEGGKRVEIKRSDIQKAVNKKVEANIKASRVLLGKVQSTPWDGFPELSKKLEQTAAELDQTSLLYGWLIPDASKMAVDLQSVDTQVSQALVSGSALEKDLLTQRDRLAKGERLPKNWRAIFEEGIKRAGAIPFPLVSQPLSTKIQTEREQIESLVKQVLSTKTALIQKAEEDLHARLKDPAVTREEWTGFLDRMTQAAGEIPEDEARAQLLERIEAVRVRTEPWLQSAEMRRAFAGVVDDLGKIELQVSGGEITAATGQERIRTFLSSLANLPEAPTREQLATRANQLAATLAPPSPSQSVPVPVVENGGGQGTATQSFLASKAIIGGAVGVVLSVGGLILLSRRKPKARPTPETIPVTLPEPHPDLPSAGNVMDLPVVAPVNTPSIPEESVAAPPLPEVAGEVTSPGEATALEELPGIEAVTSEWPAQVGSEEPAGVEPVGAFEIVLEREDKPVSDEAGAWGETGFVEISLPEATESESIFTPKELVEEEEELPATIPESQAEPEELPREQPFPEPVLPEGLALLPEPLPPLPELYLFLPEEGEDWRSKIEGICVTSAAMEERLRDTLVLGNDTPLGLARYGPHFGVVLQDGEGMNTLALLDRLSTAEEVLSPHGSGSGKVAIGLKLGLLWSLDQVCLRVSGYGEGGWVELGRLDHLDDTAPVTLCDPPSPTLFWVGENYLVGISDQPHIYKAEKADCLLRVEPLRSSILREVFAPTVFALFPTGDSLATVSREGVLRLTVLPEAGRSRSVELPDLDKTAPASALLVTDAEQLLYPVIKQTGEPRMRLFSLTSLEAERDSEPLPFVPCQVVLVEDGFLLLGEHDVALLDNVDLSVSWHYPLGARKPVMFDCDGSQLALLVHDEGEGDTVLVLGKNSGADLWDLTPAEHGLKRVLSLVFNVDWTLLLGQDQDERAVLKLC